MGPFLDADFDDSVEFGYRRGGVVVEGRGGEYWALGSALGGVDISVYSGGSGCVAENLGSKKAVEWEDLEGCWVECQGFF